MMDLILGLIMYDLIGFSIKDIIKKILIVKIFKILLKFGREFLKKKEFMKIQIKTKKEKKYFLLKDKQFLMKLIN